MHDLRRTATLKCMPVPVSKNSEEPAELFPCSADLVAGIVTDILSALDGVQEV